MDTARHRGPDPHRAPNGARPDHGHGPPGPAVAEGPSLDLWSLPLEPPAAAATNSAKFVEAWMDVLSLGSENGAAVQEPVEASPPVGSMPSPARPEPSLPVARPRSTGWKAVAVAVALIAVTGSALLALLVAFSGRIEVGGDRTAGVVTTPPVDDRVVVPGPSADCLVWLVKPRPDGSTNGVPGTCFVVG